ncbi:MAG: peptidoglycan DD-metalloendopeptidase family protein [Candidatus Aminicenantes bacterium]
MDRYARSFTGAAAALVLLALVLPLGSLTAAALASRLGPQSASPPPPQPANKDKNVADFEKRLDKINGEIKDLRSRIESEARRETTVLSTLKRINLSKSLVRKELAAQNVQLERARAALAETQAGIRTIRADLDQEREAIDKTLLALYKFGRLDFFQFLLKARDIETYSTESKRLTLLARYQEDLISGYQRSLAQLRAAQAELESRERDLAEMIRAANLKQKELDAEGRKNAALVNEIQKNRKTHERTLVELKESADLLQAMMKKIISQEWTLPFAFVPLYENKGRLPWPVEGRIITPFGFERHPNFKTVVENKGIEIAPRAPGAQVRTVHAGKVVYTDYFQGYGNLLIVDHGMTYYTLYGHCSEFLTAVGDMVETGQAVALSGDTGSLKGECLYFEMRYKTRPLDPLQWLKRK